MDDKFTTIDIPDEPVTEWHLKTMADQDWVKEYVDSKLNTLMNADDILQVQISALKGLREINNLEIDNFKLDVSRLQAQVDILINLLDMVNFGKLVRVHGVSKEQIETYESFRVLKEQRDKDNGKKNVE